MLPEERTSYNLTWSSTPTTYTRPKTIEVYLCRNNEMLEQAQRLRCEVYCRSWDDVHRLPIMTVDHHGPSGCRPHLRRHRGRRDDRNSARQFIVGRFNWYHEGVWDENVTASSKGDRYLLKFVVKKSKRGSASMKLIAAVVRYGMRNRIEECYIDCIPALLPYYKAIGSGSQGEVLSSREWPVPSDDARFDEVWRKAEQRRWGALL